MKRRILFSVLFVMSTLAVNATLNVPVPNSPADGNVYTSTIGVNCSWNTVSGASKYIIEWDTTSTFTSSAKGSQSTTYTSYSITTLRFNTKYYWRVCAINTASQDTSSWSEVRNFTTCSTVTLNSPADGNVFINTIGVNCSWNIVYGASKYIIEWDTTSTFTSSAKGSQSTTYTSYTITTLRFNTKYYWRVCAINTASQDTSSWSEVRNFTTCSTVTLNSPADGNVYTSTIGVNCSWNTVSGASKYIIEWDTTSTFTSSVKGSQSTTYTSYTITTLRFNTKYYWRVCAINTASQDTSSWSEVRNFTTCSTVTLDSPADEKVFTSTISANCSWNIVYGASKYIIEWDTTSTFTSSVKGSQSTTYTSYTITTLRFNTKYYWRVCAINTASQDTSSWSEVRNFTTCSTVTLNSPADGNVYTSTIGVNCSWNTVSGASKYIIEWDTISTFTSSAKGSQSTTYTSYTITTLRFNTKYYWRVCAINTASQDTSLWSEVRNFTTCSTVTLNSPADGATNRSLTTMLKVNQLSGAGHYIFEWDTTVMFNSPILCSKSSSSSSVTPTNSLLMGATYFWRARATNGNDSDTSAWSLPWNFTTTGAAPTLDSPSNNATGLRINPTIDWDAVSGSDYYDYQCDTTLSFNSAELQSGSMTSGTSQTTLNTLLFGTKYYWRVRSRNGADTSRWSAAWNFTTAEIITLTSPSDGTNNVGSSVNLDWNYISGGTYFEYQCDTTSTFDSEELITGNIAIGTSNTTVSGLKMNNRYYWRVRELSAVDTTAWSVVWHFDTKRTSYSSEYYQSACDSFCWNGEWYYESGDYVQNFIASDRGDSTVTMHLTLYNSVENDFSVSVEGSYEWNGQTYSQSGDYTFTFQTADGCDSVVTMHLTIKEPVGVDNVEQVVMAYPNPTSGLVSLSDYDGDVIVCDLQGKNVMQGEGESIDLSPLPEGIYLLKLNNGVVVKVMKK